MANFTALKTAINNAIKTNGNEEITGAVLQVILDAMVETLGESAITNLENALSAEITNRQNAVSGVADDLAAEALARAAKDNQLDGRINQEEYNRQNADAALSQTMSQGFQTLGSQMNALNAAISALNTAYQNGYLYGGIATPSSSPSNGKCFYIALQGGTYTNFGGVGVVEGINIIKNDSGWKVEHIYDQTTLLNEFYLLRQQVIQAITSFAPIVIEGDVTNAPDEEDLTSNANHLLQFKNNAYSPLEFSGLGRKYLRKNIAPLSESAPFNGFVEGVTAEETLSGTPTHIFWDRMNTRYVGNKDGVYYLDWTDSDNYVPVSTSLVYMYNGTPYQWTGSDFIVDETEVPNLVNCLTQDMINEANTIYIIRYDYTLKEDITIPANCVLQFDGGSISGGTISTPAADLIVTDSESLKGKIISSFANEYFNIIGNCKIVFKEANKNVQIESDNISIVEMEGITTNTISFLNTKIKKTNNEFRFVKTQQNDNMPICFNNCYIYKETTSSKTDITCTIQSWPRDFEGEYSGRRIIINGCYIYNCGFGGAELEVYNSKLIAGANNTDNIELLHLGENSIVRGCIISCDSSYDATSDLIDCYGGQNITIDSNLFKGINARIITIKTHYSDNGTSDVGDTRGNIYRFLISNNKFENCATNNGSIYVANIPRSGSSIDLKKNLYQVFIERNTFKECNRCIVLQSVSDVFIRNNTFSYGTLVTVFPDAGNIKNIFLEQNICTYAKTAGTLYGDLLYLRRGYITNLQLISNGVSQYLISEDSNYVETCKNFICINNVSYNIRGIGKMFNGSSNPNFAFGKVENNIIRNVGQIDDTFTWDYTIDTTIDFKVVGKSKLSNGKPIWWTGSAWVDATGATV